jgi:hypothetical protein
MTIEVLGRAQSGKIYIRDDRSDGSILLLICEELDNGGGIIAAATTGESDDDDGPYPMLEKRGVAEKRFVLDVDTSKMPSGVLKFDSAQFVDRALSVARDGVKQVELTEEIADDWGYRGEGVDRTSSYPSA